MTGRDLIIYILTNNLEDEPVFKDGRFIGFITASEAAVRLDVGTSTIYTMIYRGLIPGVLARDVVYIPADFKLPAKGVEGDGQ